MDKHYQLLRHQQYIHDTNRNNGFWEEGLNRNQGETVALIVSELSEALEAHRNFKRFLIEDVFIDELSLLNHETPEEELYKGVFETRVKDTVEDEMADAVIRILDYAYGFSLTLYRRIYRKESTGNFAHDLLRIQWYCIKAFHHAPDCDWGYVIASILAFCSWHGIDLDQHVQWKMKYNRMRPYKHAKAY